MTVSETWEDFESALTSVLLDLEEREMVTIKLAGGEIPFIQRSEEHTSELQSQY